MGVREPLRGGLRLVCGIVPVIGLLLGGPLALSAQLICAEDPTRTVFAGGAGEGGAGGACRQFDGDQASCNVAFHLGHAGIASCYYDGVEGECRGCGPNNREAGNCTNSCAPAPACAGDPSRTIFAGGPSSGQSGGACRRFDNDETSCDQAFHIGGSGIATCFYDAQSDQCRGCGPRNARDGSCTNTCIELTCPGDLTRTAFAGGPGTSACQQFNGAQSGCEQAFHRTRTETAQCFYDSANDLCLGCGPNNERDRDCVNSCPASTCEQDPSRTVYAGGPGTRACHRFDGDGDTCNLAFHRDGFGNFASCFPRFECVPCGFGAREDVAVGEGGAAGGPEERIPLGCLNDCVPPPTCLDQARTTFAGGPGTVACKQFDGNQSGCEQAYHLGRFGVASCFYDGGECRGCGIFNEGSGECTNTCVPPPTCAEDQTRTNFAGGPRSNACRQYDQDPTTCAISFHRTRDGTVASCFHDGSSCRGCGFDKEGQGLCTNTCMPPVCAEDSSRTIFAGGPGRGQLGGACTQFDTDQANCEAAFHRSGTGIFAPCFFDNGSCRGCGPSNEGSGACSNTCLHAPSCTMDSSRTIFVGHPGSDGCRRFSGNQTSCLMAFNLGLGGVESCWYDTADDECRGCGPFNLNRGLCSNTCAGPPMCDDPNRTFGACGQFDGNPAACNQAFQAGFDGSVSCFAVERCFGCGLFNQADGECSNTCFEGLGDEAANCSDGIDNDGDGLIDCGDPDCAGDRACTAPAPVLSWPGLLAAILLLGGVAAYRLRRASRR
jgi:hypothetical protein